MVCVHVFCFIHLMEQRVVSVFFDAPPAYLQKLKRSQVFHFIRYSSILFQEFFAKLSQTKFSDILPGLVAVRFLFCC